MAKKVIHAHKIIAAGKFVLPSPDDVERAKTPGGAWTAKQLAEWGISWPPRHGWRTDLARRWEAQNQWAGPVTSKASRSPASLPTDSGSESARRKLERAADKLLSGASQQTAVPSGKIPVPVKDISAGAIEWLRLLREGPVNRDDGPIPEATANALLGRGLLMFATIYPQGYGGSRTRNYEITQAGVAALNEGV